ncbi:sigma-54 dependent transcriptional regulator [Desulfobacula sp.]|uniref:sigma-54-dependent transcriptional regulator n=1 Tax=Desulfobacula sp. TaxID=2593537 RepID=UPI002621551D|nr:sigma-54 dependent transcriptional regulator [Desulfobacula sp.]
MSDPQKILIIDDEPSICSGCKIILTENGYDVETALSGQKGLEKIFNDPFDLILLDIRLPDITGIEILKKINEKKMDVSVIIMTGHGTVENAVEAMKNGAFDFITKPFNEKELEKSILKALESRALVQENLSLKKQLYDKFSFDNIIGNNRLMAKIFNKIERVAPLDSTVLLEGESGTGKELFANAIHAHSNRSAKQIIAMDCNTFSASLMESELFGHEKGAFTGADRTMPGIFEIASNSTLFLDEVTNLDLDIQGKLLRVLETGEYKSVGSNQVKKTNARIITATNMDLKKMVAEKKFREDLFYRLNVFPIHIPPLRDRKNDIPKLAYHFLKRFCRKTGKQISGFSDDALKVLVNHDWPGNVRQLKNVVERLIIMSDGNQLNQKFLYDHLEIRSESTPDEIPVPRTLDELKAAKKQFLETHFSKTETSFLKRALLENDGNITRAAKMVGMQRSNFSTQMKKYNITYSKT